MMRVPGVSATKVGANYSDGSRPVPSTPDLRQRAAEPAGVRDQPFLAKREGERVGTSGKQLRVRREHGSSHLRRRKVPDDLGGGGERSVPLTREVGSRRRRTVEGQRIDFLLRVGPTAPPGRGCPGV